MSQFTNPFTLAVDSQWVHPGPDGKLVLKTTPAGDRIMDFSFAGYGGGGVPLPHVPAKATVRPSSGEDDTATIQAAIDQVAALPLQDGFRGAVLLAPGIFQCSRTITISASGIVLRGSGSGVDGGTRSTIRMTGQPHLAILVRAPADGGARQDPGSARAVIADAYVPSGSTTFTVDDAECFAVGDTVLIHRPVTPAWIRLMQMDDLVCDGQPQTWLKAGNTLTTERRIAAISGNTLTVDVPLSDSFDARYLNPPRTAVVKIAPPQRLSQVGLEDLHIQSPPQAIRQTQPHFMALRMTGEDCWVRDLLMQETMNSVAVGGRRITLQRVAVKRKALHQGASRPAEFASNASELLLDRCTVTADNVSYVATGSGQAGPIVLLNCIFTGDGHVEAQQRWSTGMLIDNCRVPRGAVDLCNRGTMGAGHGWPMGWGVAWNCIADHYTIQNPPGAANWMIGCIGRSKLAPRPGGPAANLPEGIVDSPGVAVTPQSLYMAQLVQRLGPQALKDLGY
jgi:hypothetical protein